MKLRLPILLLAFGTLPSALWATQSKLEDGSSHYIVIPGRIDWELLRGSDRNFSQLAIWKVPGYTFTEYACEIPRKRVIVWYETKRNAITRVKGFVHGYFVNVTKNIFDSKGKLIRKDYYANDEFLGKIKLRLVHSDFFP